MNPHSWFASKREHPSPTCSSLSELLRKHVSMIPRLSHPVTFIADGSHGDLTFSESSYFTVSFQNLSPHHIDQLVISGPFGAEFHIRSSW